MSTAPSATPFRPALPALAALLALLAGCPADAGAPRLDDLRVEPDDACALTAFVRFRTDVPASARVEYGEEALEFVARGAAPATEHELLLIGLHADTDYTLEVVATAASGAETRSQPLAFTAGPLPFPDVEFELTHDEPDRVQPGWTVTNLVRGSMLAPTVALILDEDARPVWYHELGPEPGSGDVEVTWTDDGRVVIGGGVAAGQHPVAVDLAGRPLWIGPEQPEGIYATGGFHHAFRPLDDGGYLALRYDVDGGGVDDRVERLDEDGETVWSWLASEHTAFLGDEYLHGNSAMLSADGTVFHFGSRYTSSLLKVDVASGDVLWTLGEGRDFTYDGDHDTPWFLRAHARAVLPDGHVLLYDNGATDEREWSRAVEYELDEDAMTARIVWEYPGPDVDDEWFTFAWGDADRLDNGNTLVCAGTMVGRQSQSRVFEVTADGDKVWQVLLSVAGEEELAGAYMAQRIPDLRERL